MTEEVAMTTEQHDGPRALIVVDVQPTFCEGGELPVVGGNAVATRIAEYLRERGERYDLVITTQDWHVDPGSHFSDQPDFIDTWPPHGIAGTPNAELHPAITPALAGLPRVRSLRKGSNGAAYSGFEATDETGRSLDAVLREAGVEAVDICGIAESHCVKATALDAVRRGYQTTVYRDLTVPVSEELGERARAEMAAAGVQLVWSHTSAEDDSRPATTS
ncbi:MAG: isochorismatase family protein [Acidothermus sp.]|nr:isochorismatase family protein [Acidothermus sp.]